MSLLVVKNLAKRFPSPQGGLVAVHRFSAHFPSTGLIAIEGKSGSGKSTLLNLLSGLEKPSSGAVYFLGKDIRTIPNFMGREVSFIFQHYNLIDGESAFANASLPLRIRGEKTECVLPLFNKMGLGKLANAKVETLSGGEKQRVALCRALLSNPSIIFADEPTGALDEANSRQVMAMLREASKKRLVLLVSHNASLIREYADMTIHISGGRVELPQALHHPHRTHAKPKALRHSRGYLGRFVFRNLKKNAFKDTMCVLAGIVGFASALLSFGFFAGNAPALEREHVKSLCYMQAKISLRQTVELPGSAIRLVKQTRPSVDDVDAFLKGIGPYTVAPNYDYFFPSAMPFSVDGQDYDPVSVQPIYDITLVEYGGDLLQEGEVGEGGFDICVANTEFVERYGAGILGKEIVFNPRCTITVNKTSHEVFVPARFRLVAVVDEFPFMNAPRLYYSYPALAERLESVPIEGAVLTIPEMVDQASDDAAVTSYSSLVFFHEVSSIPELYRRMESAAQEGFEIESICHATRASFLSLSEAFVTSMGLFVMIGLIGLALILAMSSLSSFLAGKKESAILRVLGSSEGDIVRIYVTEAMTVGLLSGLISLAISPFFQQIANYFFEKRFAIPGLVDIPYRGYWNVPFLPILLVVGFATILGFLSSFIPTWLKRHIPIAEELRDE